ncbi:hypothetical protein LAZ67_11001597 [Cordylochernes scorpioides]|uniref:Uncharacterized protein n=1 Tax=Cordylochernes scorpioides TaxID=51811 RepID=A0ABY6KYK6_9ARAC|nr:hypothetical protein LAZ67_11001597 [Cordylochernes scorpioides]
MEIDHYIPENFKEAMDSGERNEWHKAMEDELSEIEKHKVWTLVPRENGMKVINSKWVYSTKKTPSDGIYKRKARLVAVGCNQRYGVDYKESFSPVLKKESLRTIVALETQQNLTIKTYDVKTAYLYDDLIIAGTSKEINDNLASEIEKYVTLTENKDSEPFIGIEIKREEDGFYLSQTHYIDTILHRFGLEECNSVQTPVDQNQNLDEYLDSKPVDKTVYQEMIGSLMYLSTGTRPDISFNVSNLSQYSNDPREILLTGVKRIYRYLKGTRDNMLAYKSKDNNITISTDASWCTTRDAKSYSGYTVKLGNNLINWRNHPAMREETGKGDILVLLLEQQKLLELLEGLEIKPNVVSSDSNSESSLQNWKSEDVKARMLLSQAIELKFLQPLMNCTSASQMWQKLLAIHEQKSEFTIGLLWQQFFDARLTSETISDYIAKIENISAQISQMGGTITEDQKVAKILNTLPSSMRYFVAAWESLDPKAQTLNNLTARLLIEETRNQQSGSSKQDEALLHRQARTKPKDTQRSFQDAKKNTKCHYCHKIGHWSRECRKRLANEKNKSKNLHDSKGSSSDYGLILCDNQVEPNDIWYADSGASCSMTFRREWFKTYTPFTSDHPIYLFTAPYVHEQIGRIERDNRTIVEAARSMLNSRNLPGFFWAEACNTATYILNRSATKQTPGTTPYELFFGTKPNVANYKIFGCNAYMHIPKENRKKWDNKSMKLMFLGYENTSKNFRLWDWKTRKIRISKDVTFDEKATPHSDRESTKPKEIIFQINSAPDESPVATTNIPVQEMLPVSDISSHPMITRSKVSNSQCNFALADEPSNYIDAITSSDSERWKLAMDEEIDALNKNKTWTLERLADALYVDDGIILSKDKEAIAIIMDELEHAFDITSGSVNFFVGLQIEQSEDRAKQKEKMPKFPFREAVGSLMFASCVSRPDITYAVSQVSKFLEYPGPAHCTTVKNIFRYLKGTPHMGILFTGQDQLVGYSDSDFARYVDSRKSTTGYAFMMNGGTVSWASQRQPIIALSTTESEYIAACSAAKELIWIRRLLQGIGCDITKETELYIDNQAAIKLVENPVFHKRTKHIDVRYHFIRSKHEEAQKRKMAEYNVLSQTKIEPLTGNNYQIWALKIGAVLRGRKLFKCVISDPEPDMEDKSSWEILSDKNDEAFGIIITTLTNEQAGMFIGETNAKKVWDSLRKTYTGNLEDKIIDIGLELKNIRMKDNETVDEYITRAKNIAARSSSLGHQFPSRELSFHIVRGIHPRYENIAIVLRSKREATIEEIQQTLREEESRRNMRLNQSVENGHEQAYRIKNRKVQQFQPKRCFVCNKKGHLANDCWFRDKQKQGYQKKWNPGYRNHKYSREHSNNLVDTMKSGINEQAFETYVKEFEDSPDERNDRQIWCIDSGCTAHLTPNLTLMENVVDYESEINLAEKGKTTQAIAKGDMRLTTCTKAIATATYIKNCTPHRSIKQNTPMQRWNGRKPSVKHIRIFGCLTHWLESKPRRNKFSPKGRKGIFIGYSIKRKAYRIYDIMTKRIHEVRSVKFSEDKRGIDYANDIQEDTNCDNLTYKGNCEEIVKDFLILKEDNPVTESKMKSQEDTSVKLGGDCENDSSQTEPIQERCVKGGRKKGETKSILEERHKARLEEQERKLIEEGVRRSQRIKDRNNANLSMEIDHYIPENFKEAMDSGERNEWHKAMEDELSEIEKHKVWTLVPRGNGMKVINSKWVYSTKKTPTDGIYKRKARLVAVGCNQRYGVDYKESFSPVLKKESLRTIVALATQQNLTIKTYDVKTAYLYGELKETVYMRQPDGFIQKGEENKVCKLEKSLYGLPQSGKCWNKKINEILYQLGMIRTKCDPCVYKLQRGEEYAILGLYVDDLIIAGTSKEINDNLASEIEKYVSLTEKKDSEPFIGIEIKREEDGFYLSQTHYIDTILHRFGLEECNSVQTPGDQNQNLDEYLDSKPVDKTVYQEMIGSLMYLSTGTRPDISFNVSNLSQYSNDPREIHLTGVKRIYRYLKGTRDNMLAYKSKDNNITISTDASWCTTRDAKSYSGYTVKLGNNLINWRSRKQNLVALSTCEAELISICEGISEVLWLKGLLEELCENLTFPITLKSDSQAAINWIQSDKITSRTKHINRKIFQGLISTLQLVERLDRYPLRNKRKFDSVEPEETSMNVKKEGAQVSNYVVQHLPRNPSIFSGEDGEDLQKWLKGYARVAKYNHWDETLCLTKVYFYLSGTALKWFENNEESIQTWKEFTSQLENVFGKKKNSKLRAEKKLKTRAQLKGESTEFYIQDVLCLCKEVDPQMSEEDKISHLMKGIAEELYQALLPRDVQSTEQFITECRRVEALRCRRVTPTRYERLPNVASLRDNDDRADLSSMIRQMVREEVQRALASPREEPEISAIKHMVQQEIEKNIAPISRSFPQNRAQRPLPSPRYEFQPRNFQPRTQQPKQVNGRRDTNEWRTTEGKPICFHCGRPGHVVRYCRDRRREYEGEQTWNYKQRYRQEPRTFYNSRSSQEPNDDLPRENIRRYRSPSPYTGRKGQHSSPERRPSQSPRRS